MSKHSLTYVGDKKVYSLSIMFHKPGVQTNKVANFKSRPKLSFSKWVRESIKEIFSRKKSDLKSNYTQQEINRIDPVVQKDEVVPLGLPKEVVLEDTLETFPRYFSAMRRGGMTKQRLVNVVSNTFIDVLKYLAYELKISELEISSILGAKVSARQISSMIEGRLVLSSFEIENRDNLADFYLDSTEKLCTYFLGEEYHDLVWEDILTSVKSLTDETDEEHVLLTFKRAFDHGISPSALARHIAGIGKTDEEHGLLTFKQASDQGMSLKDLAKHIEKIAETDECKFSKSGLLNQAVKEFFGPIIKNSNSKNAFHNMIRCFDSVYINDAFISDIWKEKMPISKNKYPKMIEILECYDAWSKKEHGLEERVKLSESIINGITKEEIMELSSEQNYQFNLIVSEAVSLNNLKQSQIAV